VTNDDRPFVIQSPTKITLTPTAREMAKLHGMTETELARHLLKQEELRKTGLTQQTGES
jgi:hypothetical protein